MYWHWVLARTCIKSRSGRLQRCLYVCILYMPAVRSSDAANRPHREVTTKRVTSFTTSDRSDSPATDNHMDGKMPHGQCYCHTSSSSFSHGTGTLRCLQKEMATYRHWSVSLWEDPDDVSHCRILSPDKTEWRLISATLCRWRHCFVADQLWLTTSIREDEEEQKLRYWYRVFWKK